MGPQRMNIKVFYSLIFWSDSLVNQKLLVLVTQRENNVLWGVDMVLLLRWNVLTRKLKKVGGAAVSGGFSKRKVVANNIESATTWSG